MTTTPTKDIDHVEFFLLSPEEILKLSVAEINDTRLYAQNLPRENGLLDIRMGTTDARINCGTCLQNMQNCVGHPGHILLQQPVYHVYYGDFIMRLLQCVCYFCSSFLIPKASSDSRIIKLIQQGKNANARFATVCKLARGKKTCTNCESPQPEWNRHGLKITRTWRDDATFFDDTQRAFAEQPFTPAVARDILQNIDAKILQLLHLEHPENMIITVLLVPPPIIRPSVSFSSGSKARGHDDLTKQLQEIIKKNLALKELLQEAKGEFTAETPEFVELQNAIANYFNNGSPGVPKAIQRSGAPIRDITKRIKGKKGRIRGNLCGKRTNNSGRCVITPDSNLDIDQLGVPKLMALSLLFPERVNALNIVKLTERVQNGPDRLDGARYVIDLDGREYDLRNLATGKFLPLQHGYMVKRPLQTGDYVVLNRNPSLHKKSLMAFRVILLAGNTLRLNLSVTTPLNADFDGDECTLHVVSDFESKTELQEIMHVNKQLLNGQSNRAAMGLVQDALVGAFLLTGKDIFLEKQVFMNMLMWLNYGDPISTYELPVPAILKPRPLWTGKQLFSKTLPGQAVNLHQIVRNADPKSSTPLDLDERWIYIRHGELLCGRLCKITLGPVGGGLVHILAKDWGVQRASEFLSDAQRLITNWLTNNYGFSVGLNDCIVPKEVHVKVKNIIQRAYRRIDVINERATEFHAPEVESGVSQLLQKILDLSGRAAQASLPMDNAILTMTQAGSKGNVVNLSQITAAIGLQLMEAKRVPRHTVTGRSLTHFPMQTNTAESRAFISHNFYSGLTPTEFFFHAATGREGLVDSAVRTATVGYMNRRAIKAAESVHVAYDWTLRNAQKYIVDFVYGGADSMDSEMLERVKLQYLDWSDAELQNWFKFPNDVQRILALRDQVRAVKQVPFLPAGAVLDSMCLLPVNLQRVIANFISLAPTTAATAPLCEITHNKWIRHLMYDLPCATVYWQFCVATSLAMVNIVDKFSEEMFEKLAWAIECVYGRSRVQPGEGVGALCAQSIGEPTTQMTLNSFHHSGLSKASVHMGMPRLLELWDCNTTHSSMTIILREEPAVDAELLAARCVYTLLEDLASGSVIWSPDDDNIVPGASKWLLKLSLKRNVMQERHISIRTVVQRIRDLFADERKEEVDGTVEYFTEPNNDQEPPYILVRPHHMFALAQEAENPKEANRVLLEDFKQKLLSEIDLGGIRNIKNAWTRQINHTIYVASKPQTTTVTVVETDGTALCEIAKLPQVDPHQTYSNNIEEILEVLGLEAAIFMLFHEMRNIFVAEGTTLDERHYLTLVSVMSFRGYLVPIRRHGLNNLDTGPLSKSTFEKSMDTFREACLFHEADALSGPSESLLFAQKLPLGTGLVELVYDPVELPFRPRPPELLQTAVNSQTSQPIHANQFFAVPLMIPSIFLPPPPPPKSPSPPPTARSTTPRHQNPTFLQRLQIQDPNQPRALLFVPPSPDLTLQPPKPISRIKFFPPSPRIHEEYDPQDPGFIALPQSPNYPPPQSPEYSPNSPSYPPPKSPEYSPMSPSYPPPKSPEYSPMSPSYQPRDSPSEPPMSLADVSNLLSVISLVNPSLLDDEKEKEKR